MKVLLLGSGGFLGKHLLRKLQSMDFEVDAISSSNDNGINPKTGLLDDSFFIARDVDAVIYLSQSPYYNQTPQFAQHVMNVNVISAIHAANAAIKADVKRFIYLSTGTVYAPTFESINESTPTRKDSWYPLSKLHAEEALSLLSNEIDIILLRPFGIYGPNQEMRLVPNIINSIKAHKPITIMPRTDGYDGDGLNISLCHVDDACKIIVHICTSGGVPILNLASDEFVSIRDLSSKIGERLGTKPIFEIKKDFRDFDLVADISLLQSFYKETFKPLNLGLDELNL